MPSESAKDTTPTSDRPLFDPIAYGMGPDDSVKTAAENAAVTHHRLKLDGKRIAYTARAGHLIIVDPVSSRPNATLFYVDFRILHRSERTRPVTFFYNGGPGSSSVFLLLGSFAPMRIKTSMPDFTPPAPYAMEVNADSLIDRSDLVFINPVGTGYSAAIAPAKNRDFWGVDQDARSIQQFIERYLTASNRWNSPKFLFGESYGTARSAVLAYMLHEAGIDINGVVLQSSILDYTQTSNPIGLLPTCAADAWYHHKNTMAPPPKDLPGLAKDAEQFAHTVYRHTLQAFPEVDAAVVKRLSAMTGIDPGVLEKWSLNVASRDKDGTLRFLVTLLKSRGLALGAYDGRITAIDTGIAAHIDPNSGGNDPTMTAVNGVYTTMWHYYLANELRFTSNSAFTDLNDQAFSHWDFSHIDPTGAKKGVDATTGNIVLYTAGDLAAAMSLNVDLKVLSANGYFDAVTPFYQTMLDLQAMPLISKAARGNLTIRCYPSGHMVYLDGDSRAAFKGDLATFYASAVRDTSALRRVRTLQAHYRERQ